MPKKAIAMRGLHRTLLRRTPTPTSTNALTKNLKPVLYFV
jgi:hypothetical protein